MGNEPCKTRGCCFVSSSSVGSYGTFNDAKSAALVAREQEAAKKQWDKDGKKMTPEERAAVLARMSSQHREKAIASLKPDDRKETLTALAAALADKGF